METLTTAQFLHSATLQKKPSPPLWNSNTSFLSTITRRAYSIPKPSSLRRSLPLSVNGDATTQPTSLLSDDYNHHRFVSSLTRRLGRPGSCPLRLLQEDGDWRKDHFWAVIRFLRHSSRLHEILPVYNAWKNLEPFRVSVANYERIIRFLCEERSMNEAIRSFRSMIDDHELSPSLEIYNSIIHGYADDGKFEEAMFYLSQMKENGLSPISETYDGLIEAYGKWKMYDEIVLCVRRMESDGCVRDHVTYNLLIREFSRGGLLKRMEQMYQSLMSRKMTLEPCTLLSMLEAYAEFGVIEKMEETCNKVIRFGICLDDGLVRKLANVYIDNLMLSRLDDLGRGISYSRTRRTDLAWCLRLLCHARLVSRKGLDYVVKEMKEARVTWNSTFANIVLLAYSKMGDFKSIELLLDELRTKRVKLDLVTVGIVYDLSEAGFDGTGVFITWKKIGFLDKPVEIKTDPLVHAAFGKGRFIRSCEEMIGEESTQWTYQNLMELVVKNQKTAL
ncbi:PREDICTED: pentatricopeptide repeat-containing protein At4g14190, chloroplastic-like [Camelina sativa]|uniref:Pentatricopeptide repeat-containing protein At4g14190, chloroplastic-like n=1 Tax=Camelina sativa TaxID=90675 RepID=A0ABM0UFT4_CAMSA|nr:PREDICTED: pentatricopeptide repeat-containing protein At4g14190, chloroplastic-like [Camelina sativa]